jgi:penicillin-binding protein 1C
VDALRWRLGDRDLGRAGTLVLWPPRPGTHVLALVDAEGGVADRVVFHVRGAAVARDDGAGD